MNQTQAKSHEKSLNFATVEKIVETAFFKSGKLDHLARQKGVETGERQVANCQQSSIAQDNF
jgi:hypothetical protein